MEEITSEGKEKEVWRLEPEGEAEKVNGVSVNPEGESRNRHALAKMARKDRENQTIMDNSKWEGTLGRRMFQVPKRKVIRVESEETQVYVRESLNLSREEAEEIRFVPSTLSFPTRAYGLV